MWHLHPNLSEPSGTLRHLAPRRAPEHTAPSGTLMWHLHQNFPEPSRKPPERSGTLMWHLHRNLSEPSATLRNLLEPCGTLPCDVHQNTPELIIGWRPQLLRCWGKTGHVILINWETFIARTFEVHLPKSVTFFNFFPFWKFFSKTYQSSFFPTVSKGSRDPFSFLLLLPN